MKNAGLIGTLLMAIAGAAVLPAIARAQTSVLDPTSLSCTRNSFELGFKSLSIGFNAFGDPQCSENLLSNLDEITYYSSANCVVCSPQQQDYLIAVHPLQVQIGLKNGPCPLPVQVYFQNAAYPPSGLSTAYLGARLTTTATANRNQLSLFSSVDCTATIPTYTESGNGDCD